MRTKKIAIWVVVTLACVHLTAAEGDVTIAPYQDINEIPVIPSAKAGGINAFKGSSKRDQHEGDDRFNMLDLATQGNKNAAAMSGMNVEALTPKKHKEGYKRPKIGLVLSGGGARGGAHLGMIQALERHNIPIDAIVGTSMGSFVGGLYASGMSSSEIERALTTMDWTKVITFDYDRQEIPFRQKQLQRAFPGKAKMGVNQDNDVVLGTGLFKRQTMLGFLKDKTYGVSDLKSFDELRIPFRSVASRLEDGHTRILRDGCLAEAIYASLAIPGGFDPITIEGEVLVDGGVADNLPVDVMREEMGMDYIIVVDISTPYDEHAEFDNYLSVMGQLVNILMRKNVEDTVENMEGNSSMILVRPDLTGYGSLDADKYPQIIAIGLAKGEEVYNRDLSHLSLYESDYYSYLADRAKPKKYVPPVIDKIELENKTYLNDKKILSYIHAKVGEKLDDEQLNKDVMDIYNLMIFDDVSYEVVQKNGLNVLVVHTTPSWDVNGQLKFALGFEDNFNGHSDYSVKLEYIKFGLNAYAGEWRTHFTFGQENLILTELYQPIDPYGHVYIRPAVYYRNKKVYVSPSILGQHDITADLDDTLTLQAREYGGIFGLGANLSNDNRIEVDAAIKNVSPSGSFVVYDALGNGQYAKQSSEALLYILSASINHDSLDNAFFPRKGHRLELGVCYNNQFKMKDADVTTINEGKTDYSQYNVDYASAFTYARHTWSPHFKLSQTFKSTDFENAQDFGSYATLGGLFNLSGLPTNALTGSDVAFASMVYRYRLTDDGFFGALTPPMYAGFSLESGNAWYSKDLDPVNGQDSFSTDTLKYAGSVYLAADTIIGPFYLGGGATEYEGRYYYSAYISLGAAF